MICPHCKSDNPPSSTVCVCGYSLGDNSRSIAGAGPAPAPRRARVWGVATYVIISLLAIIAGLLCLLYLSNRDKQAFGGVDAAASDIQAAVAVGVNASQFSEKLQRFASEVAQARLKGGEPRRLSAYSEALLIYQDANELLSYSVRFPTLFEPPGIDFNPLLKQMGKRYNATPDWHGLSVLQEICRRADEKIAKARAM